jgi:hypothetical protein
MLGSLGSGSGGLGGRLRSWEGLLAEWIRELKVMAT